MISTSTTIPAGDAGIDATLRRMRSTVRQAVRDPLVVEWAHDVVRELPAREKDHEAEAFLRWIRRESRYTNDPTTAELVKSPEVMIREWRTKGRIVGDCDDLVVLLATGLTIVGLPVEFVVVGENDIRSEFTHVLLTYLSPSRGWVTMDPIVKHPSGWFPSTAARVGRLGAYGGLKPSSRDEVLGSDRDGRVMDGAWTPSSWALALLAFFAVAFVGGSKGGRRGR